MKGLRWRIWVVAGTVAFAAYLLLPTYLRFGLGKQVPKVAKAEDPWYMHVLPSETLKLGLDLSGGLHLVVGVDMEEVSHDAALKLKTQIKDLADQEKIEGVTYDVGADNTVTINFPNEATWKRVDAVIGKHLGAQVDFVSQSSTNAKVRMSAQEQQEVQNRAIDQSLETLRNRIDEFGIAEPIIQREGDDKILIQFPGVQEPGRLKEIIARTAKLSFQLVRTGPEEPNGVNGAPSESQLQAMVAEFEKAKNMKADPAKPMPDYVKALNAYVAGKIPAGTEILLHKTVNVNTREAEYVPYLLDHEAMVTGTDLADAYYGFDPQNNEPIVNFQLTPSGATKFEKATGENVGRMMAIVLDQNVHSAPRIKTKIPGGRAMIEMGASGKSTQDIMNEAKDTSLVLRSGALPARLTFLEERVIGPSLGADAIRAGVTSLAAGLALVGLFMSIYYRTSGLLSILALGLNGIFVLACMAAFEGTLTLPGLAGLTLTLGMAIDANVLIYEHMREELRIGKSAVTAIQEGYHRAFSAILDGHVTAIVAGMVLFSFGYGPIRGFAVTMLIGLVASMYTSIFVTRLMMDVLIVSRNKKHISV